MYKIIQYFILLFFLFLIIKIIINRIIIIKKSNKFINKYFNDKNKLYSIGEVANAFKLDEEHLLKLLSTLEKYNYFSFFNKRGVIMTKDYYSQYELKYLSRLLSKKIKIKY